MLKEKLKSKVKIPSQVQLYFNTMLAKKHFQTTGLVIS